MIHESFPIADFESGIILDKEPWLSKNNAFVELVNGRPYNGRIERRSPYARLSELGILVSSINGFLRVGSNCFYNDNPNYRKIIPESIRLSITDAGASTLEAECRGDREYSTLEGWYQYIIYEAGTSNRLGYFVPIPDAGQAYVQCNWTLHSGYTGYTVSNGVMDYYYSPVLPCIGLRSFQDATSQEYLIALDTRRPYLYDASDGFFKDISAGPGDMFTGDSSNLFWMWPADDFLVFTNNVDPVHKFTPGGSPEVEELSTDWDSGSPGNDLDTCLIILRHRGRLIFINTQENGSRFTRRARWTASGGAFESYDSADAFQDAPSEYGDAITGGFIGDQILIGFEFGWMELRPTNEPGANAYRYEKIPSNFGCLSKLSTIQDASRLISITQSGIQAIDVNSQYPIDVDIPDETLKWNASQIGKCVSFRNFQERQMLWSYPSSNSDDNDKTLVLQYDKAGKYGFCIYDFGATCFSEYRDEDILTIDDLDMNISDADFAWDSSILNSGYSTLIFGTLDGTVMSFNNLVSYDYSATILPGNSNPVLFAKTIRINPYKGRMCHVSHVDFIIESTEDIDLTIQFYSDYDQNPYKTSTINYIVSEKKRVYTVMCNRNALWHTITIESDGDIGPFYIDAIIPWIKPTGRMRQK